MQRLKLESKNSNIKVKAQIDAKDGIVYPLEDTRSFADKQNDEFFQQEEGFTNVHNKLLKDKSEAQSLLKALIQNDMLSNFNINFPRIFREIKTNFTDLGSAEAFREIKKIIAHVANSANEQPLNKKAFADAISNLSTTHLMKVKMKYLKIFNYKSKHGILYIIQYHHNNKVL
jgi:hypothetical protein